MRKRIEALVASMRFARTLTSDLLDRFFPPRPAVFQVFVGTISNERRLYARAE
jgi:hypothetical protein